MFTSIKRLFFHNQSLRQTVFKNTFWLSVAEVATGFLRFALLVYATRILGAVEYGKFTFALSFVSIMVICSDLGLINIATRELSRNKEKENEFSELLSLDIVLTAGAFFLTVAGSFLVTDNMAIRKMIWFLSVFILITSFFGIFFAFLRSRQKMEYEAATKVLQSAGTVVIAFFAVYYFRSAIGLAYGYLLANLIVLALFLVFFHVRFQPLKLRWNKKIFHILKISWPMSLGFMNSWMYMTVASVMLGYFNLIAENGWYGAASKIVILVLMPGSLIVGSFYPALSSLFVNSPEKIQKSFDYLMAVMVSLSIPMMVGAITLAPKIIPFFYGSGFTPSVATLQLLMPLVLISFIGYPYSVALVIADQQKKNFYLILAGIGMTTALNFLLIPSYGLQGAAISLLISSGAVLLASMITLKFFTRIPIIFFNMNFLKYASISSLASLMMFFALRHPAVYNLTLFVAVAIGFACYALVFLVLRKLLRA